MIIATPPTRIKDKKKKKEKSDQTDNQEHPIEEFLQKLVPPSLDDIPPPDLESAKDFLPPEETQEKIIEGKKELQENKEKSRGVHRPPIPQSSRPLSIRPPAPRPLPITTKEKKTEKKSSQFSETKTTFKKTKPEIFSSKSDIKKATEISSNKPKEVKQEILANRERLLQSTLTQTNLLEFFEDSVKNIKERDPKQGWPWITSKKVMIPVKYETRWRAEGSLLATIALLEFFHHQQAEGEISQEIYHRQLKALLIEALQLLIRLEKEDSFSFEDFIIKEKIATYFPYGLEKLRLAEGSSDLDSLIDGEKINYQELVKLPTKAADFVSNAIELLDLIRLHAIATTDRLLPLLDEMRGIINQTKNIFGDNYWVLAEIEAWRKRFSKETPGTILPEKDLERLEMQAVRWMNDFRRELKNI
ncbi:MAG: hypothetical protein ACFFD1_08055 [Candidatus Thorarchaeota archaeon]